MTARLTSAVLVSALVRRVNNAGGAAVVLSRGDETAGAVILVCREKGRLTALLERLLAADGRYRWAPAVSPVDSEQAVDEWLSRRRQRDPDSWCVELDIADAQRFAAEISGDY